MKVVVSVLSDVLAALQRVRLSAAASAEPQKWSVESLGAALQIVRFAALCEMTGIECIRSLEGGDVQVLCEALPPPARDDPLCTQLTSWIDEHKTRSHSTFTSLHSLLFLSSLYPSPLLVSL